MLVGANEHSAVVNRQTFYQRLGWLWGMDIAKIKKSFPAGRFEKHKGIFIQFLQNQSRKQFVNPRSGKQILLLVAKLWKYIVQLDS